MVVAPADTVPFGGVALGTFGTCGQMPSPRTTRIPRIDGITRGIGLAPPEETHVDAEPGRIVNANIA